MHFPHRRCALYLTLPHTTSHYLTLPRTTSQIGIDIIENADARHPSHAGLAGAAATALSAAGLGHVGGIGLGLHAHPHSHAHPHVLGLSHGLGPGGDPRPLISGVSTRERERARQREHEQRVTAAPHQRSVPLTTVTEPRLHDRAEEGGGRDKNNAPNKRARHAT